MLFFCTKGWIKKEVFAFLITKCAPPSPMETNVSFSFYMSSSKKILVFGTNGDSSPCEYTACANGEDHISASVSNDEIWVTTGSASMTPITDVTTGVLKELASLVENSNIDILSSGTSIAVCAQEAKRIINIVDPFPEDDTDHKPNMLFFHHKLAMPTVRTVRKISCGDNHCLVLCGTSCFSYGSNAYGELGVGVRSEHRNTLQAVHISPSLQISDIAAGNTYSALVTRCGQVYTFGNGAYFKLGHGDDEDRLVPTRVVELENVGEFQSNGTFAGVKYIACGRWHTVVVTHGTNDVYGWGWNKFGNFGANPTSTRGDFHSVHKEEIIALPRRIEDLDVAHLLGDGGSGRHIDL